MPDRSDHIFWLERLAIVKRNPLAKSHSPNLGLIRGFKRLSQIGADVAAFINLSQQTPNRQSDREHVVVEICSGIKRVGGRTPAKLRPANALPSWARPPGPW